jgi:protocatechuate 3,4-dioxygenase beta subunit
MKIYKLFFLIIVILTGLTIQVNAQKGSQTGTPPNAPTGLIDSVESWNNFPFIELQWQGETGATAKSIITFNIYRKNTSTDASGEFIKLYKNILTRNFKDLNVENGKTYYYFVTASNHAGESTASDTVEAIVGSPAVRAVIAGTLKDSTTGSPIPHAQVYFIPLSGWSLNTVSPDSITGAFSTSVAPGTYIIYAFAPGYVSEYYNDVTQIMKATRETLKSGDSLNLVMTLKQKVVPQKFTISGNVSDTAGKPLKAYISLYNIALNAWSRLYYQAVTDSSGNYSVQVKQGDTLVAYAQPYNQLYIPQFYNDETSFQTADRIAVAQNVAGINFVLLHKPTYNNGISGQVTNTDSAGVPSIVQAIPLRDTTAKHRYSVKTDSLGNFSFSQLIPADYILLAIPQNGYIPTFYTVADTQTLQWRNADSVVVTPTGTVTGINIVVTALSDSGAATVHGQVKDNHGSPLNGAFVYAENSNQQTASFGISDDQGNYTISGLIPGSYIVSSQLYGYDNNQLPSSVSLSYSTQSSVSASSSFSLTPDDNVTAVKESTPAVTASFKLNQNYPNPFNPSTIISYSIPNQSKVTLKVYNILGSEVATLVDEYKPAGNYSVIFNAARLSSGVYFYQIKAGNFVSTKKLMLLK